MNIMATSLKYCSIKWTLSRTHMRSCTIIENNSSKIFSDSKTESNINIMVMPIKNIFNAELINMA